MKVYYDSTVPANGIENTELTSIKSFPKVISIMDTVSSCTIIVADFEGALYDTWKDLNYRKVRVDDDATNVIWRGYIVKKSYTHNEMTLNCRGIAAVMEWTNFTENYILESGLVKTVPDASDDSRIEMKQDDEDGGYPDFTWTPDEWHTTQNVGLILFDVSAGNSEKEWACQNAAQDDGTEVSGAAADVNTWLGNSYYCTDVTTVDMVVTTTMGSDGGQDLATTNAIKKITIKYKYYVKNDNINKYSQWDMYIDKTGESSIIIAECYAMADTEWATASGIYTIEGTDAELAKFLKNDPYDEMVGIHFDCAYADDKTHIAVDYILITIEYNPIDYDTVQYSIDDNDATWLGHTGMDWDDDTGVQAGDKFRIGQNTTLILQQVTGRAGVGLQINSTLSKYVARYYKGMNCLQIFNSIMDLEGLHWWEDYINDRVIIATEADFAASGVTIDSSDYAYDWNYEDPGSNVYRVDVFGSAALDVHAFKEDTDIDSPKHFTIIDEQIITNVDAQLVANAKFTEMSVKTPSIKLKLHAVNIALTVGTTINLTMERPTIGADDYPIRRIDREKSGGEIRTTIYCGMGKTPLIESLGRIIQDNANRSQKAHTDRLISSTLGATGTVIGAVNWDDITGKTTGVIAVMATADKYLKNDANDTTTGDLTVNKLIVDTFNITQNGDHTDITW